MEPKIKFIVSIPEGCHRALKVKAAEEGKTMNGIIVELLSKHLKVKK